MELTSRFAAAEFDGVLGRLRSTDSDRLIAAAGLPGAGVDGVVLAADGEGCRFRENEGEQYEEELVEEEEVVEELPEVVVVVVEPEDDVEDMYRDVISRDFGFRLGSGGTLSDSALGKSGCLAGFLGGLLLVLGWGVVDTAATIGEESGHMLLVPNPSLVTENTTALVNSISSS